MIASLLITGGNHHERYKMALDKIAKSLLLKTGSELQKFIQSPDFVTEQNGTSIGIEDIRRIEHTVFLKPYEYQYKILLIDEAQRMTIPAQNAFLKTLEEPPKSTGIILLSKYISGLLPTIVSRCQINSLPAKQEILISEKDREIIQKQILIIVDSDLGAKFRLAEEWGKDKDTASLALEKWCIVARENVLNLVENKKILSQLYKDNIFQKLLIFLRKISLTKIEIEANVNPRFALENLFMTC